MTRLSFAFLGLASTAAVALTLLQAQTSATAPGLPVPHASVDGGPAGHGGGH